MLALTLLESHMYFHFLKDINDCIIELLIEVPGGKEHFQASSGMSNIDEGWTWWIKFKKFIGFLQSHLPTFCFYICKVLCCSPSKCQRTSAVSPPIFLRTEETICFNSYTRQQKCFFQCSYYNIDTLKYFNTSEECQTIVAADFCSWTKALYLGIDEKKTMINGHQSAVYTMLMYQRLVLVGNYNIKEGIIWFKLKEFYISIEKFPV